MAISEMQISENAIFELPFYGFWQMHDCRMPSSLKLVMRMLLIRNSPRSPRQGVKATRPSGPPFGGRTLEGEALCLWKAA